MSRSIADLDLIGQRAEAMASQISDQMALAHETEDQAQLDWLHTLIQHLVVIRQAALAIKEADPEPQTRIFQMPKRPDGVTAVYDSEGYLWKMVSRRRRTTWHCEGEFMTWEDLLFHYGPLIEET